MRVFLYVCFMDKLKESAPKINFLGYRCTQFNFQASEAYTNGESPDGLIFEVNYGPAISEDDSKRFIITFDLSLVEPLKEGEKTTIIKGSFMGLFSSSEDLDDEFLNSPFVKINAPAILYPFIRAYISTITINASLEAILLPTLNFAARASKQPPA